MTPTEGHQQKQCQLVVTDRDLIKLFQTLICALNLSTKVDFEANCLTKLELFIKIFISLAKNQKAFSFGICSP